MQPDYVNKLKRIVYLKPESPKQQQATEAITSNSVTPRIIKKVNNFNPLSEMRQTPTLTPKLEPTVTSPKGDKVTNYFKQKNQSVPPSSYTKTD